MSKYCTDCATQNKYDDILAGNYSDGLLSCAGDDKSIIYLDGLNPNNREIVQATRSGLIRDDVFDFTYVG